MMTLKETLIRTTIVALICLATSACSKRIARFIEEAENFALDEETSNIKVEDLGFKKDKYCPIKKNNCISYYYGPPLTSNNLQYSVKFGEGDRKNIVGINLSRNSLERHYSGTVILLHGFRTAKEFMLNSALYFRFLGFQVVVPDLLGHGGSGGRRKYGVEDSKYINNLIGSLIEEGVINNGRIYIVGNSMGALTATYISSLRKDISGIILLAPMPPFDEAVYNYAKRDHPLLSRIIPEKDFRKGALLALKKAKINLNDTKILPIIESSQAPTLLILSDSDKISPYADFEQLRNDNIKIIKIHDRYHPSMNTIGEVEHKAIISWLNTTQN
ncbi:alpha/beta hydrolase [Microbulbifer variabilis]|uniref:alpha/beta hydrolase n=1 Tax=Microbulbifer variabilis TaxID=266805 RepID=UPI0003AABA67|nr:alpha/beta fold hydrolase [Microbulbifer variabilis]